MLHDWTNTDQRATQSFWVNGKDTRQWVPLRYSRCVLPRMLDLLGRVRRRDGYCRLLCT